MTISYLARIKSVEQFLTNQANRKNLLVAKAMVLYWQDVCDGKLPRVLWEQLEPQMRKFYINRMLYSG